MGRGNGRSLEELLKGVMEKLFNFKVGVEERRTLFVAGEDDSRTVRLLTDARVDDDFEKKSGLFKAKIFGASHKVSAMLSVEHSVVGWFEALVVQNIALLVPFCIQMFPYFYH